MLDVVRAALRPRKRAMSAAEELEQLEDARSKCNARCIEVREQLESLRGSRTTVLIEGPDSRVAEHDAKLEQLERQERDALTIREELDRRIRKLKPIAEVEAAIAAVPDLQPMLDRVEGAEEQLRAAVSALRRVASTVLAGYRAAERVGRLGELPAFSDEQLQRIEHLASRHVTGPNPSPMGFSAFEFRPPRPPHETRSVRWSPDGIEFVGGPWTDQEKREALYRVPQDGRLERQAHTPVIDDLRRDGVLQHL